MSKQETPLKFAVGDRVHYKIQEEILFTGTVTKAERQRGKKPYTIKTDAGKTQYANEKFLFPA